MTPRTGLYVALIGLVLAVLCGGAAILISDFGKAPQDAGWADVLMKGVVLVYFGVFIVFTLMLPGLAVAGAVMKPR